MKIHNLKFQNINSLKGNWEIDFDNPNLTRENIFLITGKTGSGKSSIFDAITLALYGETTRQGKITGTTNELMNKHSGECSSQVLFSTKGEKYLATFKQHRSRKLPDGKLQVKKQSLINYKTNENLVSKSLKLEDVTTNLIGLNFEQFSKTVMLAQGSFDKFLKAKDDEKASILEQITGTKIYTDISIKVFNHHKDENTQLNILKQVLGGINLLNEEEKQEKNIQIKQFKDKILAIDKTIKENEAIISYFTKLREVSEKEKDLSIIKEQLKDENEEYNKQKAKIENYNNALPIIEAINEVDSYKKTLKQAEKEKTKLKETSKEKQIQQKKLIKEQDLLKKQKALEENNLKELNKTVKKVRELDQTIESINSKLKLSLLTINTKEEELKQLNNRIISDTNKNKVKQKDLDKALLYLEENDYLSSYENKQDDILTSLDKYHQLKRDLNNTNKDLKAEQSETQTLEKAVINSEEKVKQLRNNKKELENSLKKLDFNDTEELTTLISDNQTLLQQWKNILDNYKTFYTNKEKLDSKEESKNSKTRQLEINDTKIENYKLLIDKQKEIIGLKSYTHLLEDGDPCPLCGSTNHPNILEADNSELKNLQNEFDEFKKDSRTLNSELSDLKTTILNLNFQQEELKKTLTTQIDGKIYTKDSYKKQVEDNIVSVEQKLETLTNTKQEVNNLKQEISETEKPLTEKKSDLRLHENAKQINDRNIAKYTEKEHSLTTQIQDLKLNLDDFLISKTYKQISDLFVSYNENKKQEKTLKADIKELKTLLKDNEQNKSILNNDINKLNLSYTKVKTELDQIKNKRFELFQDKDCDEQLELQTNKITKVDQLLQANIDSIEPLKSQIIQLEEKINFQKQIIDNNADLISNCEKEIDNKLVSLKIDSKQQALSFNVEKDEFKNLNENIKIYENKEIHYKALSDEINKTKSQLDKEQVKISEDEALKEQSTLRLNRDGLIKDKTIIEQHLETNKKNQEKFKDQEQKINKQQLIVNKWEILNKAIGSSDGKKFKSIAQGITLDYLIHNTNKKLLELFPRYELYRIKDENNSTSLDLGVIDKYSAAIRRPVSNLSGGETFIVSFSLALGLSDLLNKKISIETLFLDEGFGTLDEDTLTQSLEAIENLTKEGKVIGLISHVSILHDRIRSQINVQENGDSTSSLVGPGVKKFVS